MKVSIELPLQPSKRGQIFDRHCVSYLIHYYILKSTFSPKYELGKISVVSIVTQLMYVKVVSVYERRKCALGS